MNNKPRKLLAVGIITIGIYLPIGGVSAATYDSGMVSQNMIQKEESKVERKIEKVEKKIVEVQTEIQRIETSLEEVPLSSKDVQTYQDYLEQSDSLLKRLNAAKNKLNAITKNMKESSSYANEVNGLINDVRIHVLNVQETIEALLAENMSSSGDIPQNLEVAQNPAFEVGSQAIIQAEHMGMKSMSGAVATIVGAYETTAYSVTYFPTTGEEPVKDHKWVIHEEINNAGEESLEAGTEVKLNADHMEGMDGASAVIEFALETTVYMVDFTTQTGEQVVNHKWLVESELAPVE